jgi:hypothetical protein
MLIRKLKSEFEKIDFKLTDKDEGYYGNDLVKLYTFSYGDIEIVYHVYEDFEKNTFRIDSPSVKISADNYDSDDINEEIDNTLHLLQALKLIKKVIS